MDLMDRRRVMEQSSEVGWQEYPIERWGLGNISNDSWAPYHNLLYGGPTPILSDKIKFENTTAYSFAIRMYNSNKQWLRSISLNNGDEYTFASDVAYIWGVLWDKPSLSVVDTGQVKLYYWGLPYAKPPKATMTGADYDWCYGNIVSNTGAMTDYYSNCCVRTIQPFFARIMNIDLSNCAYSMNIYLFDANNAIIAGVGVSSGNSASNILASYPTAEGYTICMWDKPSYEYAANAPFVISFMTLQDIVRPNAAVSMKDIIMTNIVPGNPDNLRIEVRYKFVSSGTASFQIGSRSTNYANSYDIVGISFPNSSTLGNVMLGRKATGNVLPLNVGTDYILTFDKNNAVLNNTTYNWTRTGTPTNPTYPIYIGKLNQGGTAAGTSSNNETLIAFNYFKIYTDNILTTSLVPYKISSTDYGLCDTVTGKLYNYYGKSSANFYEDYNTI